MNKPDGFKLLDEVKSDLELRIVWAEGGIFIKKLLEDHAMAKFTHDVKSGKIFKNHFF